MELGSHETFQYSEEGWSVKIINWKKLTVFHILLFGFNPPSPPPPSSATSVADPGCSSRIRIKEFNYFNPKYCFCALGNMIRVVHTGSGSWFFTHPGSRGQKATGSRILDPQHWLQLAYLSLSLSHLWLSGIQVCPLWWQQRVLEPKWRQEISWWPLLVIKILPLLSVLCWKICRYSVSFFISCY